MKKTKIIFATESYYPQIDGGAISERKLAQALAECGYQVTILAPAGGLRNHVERDLHTKIVRLAAVELPLVKSGARAAVYPRFTIDEVVKRIQPDIIHVHNPFGIGRGALDAAKKYKIKKIATNHLMPENLTMFIATLRFMNNYKRIRNLNWGYIIRFHNNFDFVTAPTQTAVNLLLEHRLKVPAAAVSNGVDLGHFNPGVNPEKVKRKYGLPAGVPVILYTGRLSGEKNVDQLVAAMPLVLRELKVHFVLGGHGREKENLKAQVKKMGLERSVTFTGFIDEADFPAIYTAATVFAMPSVAELQSIVTMEALASGLPVVAANSCALPELVHFGRNGYLYKPGKIPELAACLVKVASDPERAQRMGRESLKIIQPHDHPRVVERFAKIYQAVLRSS